MEFLDLFKNTVPRGVLFEDILKLAPASMWENDPQKAAIRSLHCSAIFDEETYLLQYPDVAAQVTSLQLDPITHFVNQGIHEGRKWFARTTTDSTTPAKHLQNNEEPPDVSVIITSYNNRLYLEKCLKSVYKQTLKNIEIICVDDDSKDGSIEIIQEYIKKDRRFFGIFHSKNSSASRSRKDGIRQSNGKYIMFVDGDDEIESNTCEIAFNAITKHKTHIVHFDTKIRNIKNVNIKRVESNQKFLKPYTELLYNSDIIKECFENNKFGFSIWNKIYDGDIVRKAIKYIDDGYYPKANDLYLFFVVSYFCTSYIGIDTKLYTYNFGAGSISGDNLSPDQFKNILNEYKIIEQLKNFLESVHDSEKKYIIDNIEKNFTNECLDKWKNYVPKDCQRECFEYLCNVFTFKKILFILLEKFWYNRTETSKIFIETGCLQYKKKNIKVIGIYYRNIFNGGAQHVVATLCNILSRSKDEYGKNLYKIILITDEYYDKNEYEIDKNITRCLLPKRENSIKEKYVDRYTAWNDILDTYKVDLVINSLWNDPVTYWDMITVKSNKRNPAYVIHSQSAFFVNFLANSRIAYDMMLRYSLCDGVVALSRCDEYYIKSFNDHVQYIPNPIDISYIDEKKSYDCKTIVWCGRISNEKKVQDTIKMLAVVVEYIFDAKLLIVGDGSEILKKDIEKNIKNLHLDDHVELVGFTQNVHQYYKNSSVCVLTSEYEGFSLTIGEALSHGVPVVCYEMPNLEFIRDGRGIVTVPQGDYTLMGKEVVRLLKNRELLEQLGKKAKENVRKINIKEIETKWVSFINGINAKSNSDYFDENMKTLKIICEQMTLSHDTCLLRIK